MEQNYQEFEDQFQFQFQDDNFFNQSGQEYNGWVQQYFKDISNDQQNQQNDQNQYSNQPQNSGDFEQIYLGEQNEQIQQNEQPIVQVQPQISLFQYYSGEKFKEKMEKIEQMVEENRKKGLYNKKERRQRAKEESREKRRTYAEWVDLIQRFEQMVSSGQYKFNWQICQELGVNPKSLQYCRRQIQIAIKKGFDFSQFDQNPKNFLKRLQIFNGVFNKNN